jgi:NADH:ubiquinone reductase (H+-translocating)
VDCRYCSSSAVLYKETKGLELDKKGRVLVDAVLQAKGNDNVFVVGDAAATRYAGMAQTAIRDASFVAKTMYRKLHNHDTHPYTIKPPVYAVPVGAGYAAVVWRRLHVYGRMGWWIRRLADIKFFLSILPLRKALVVFRSGSKLCESCPVCCDDSLHR